MNKTTALALLVISGLILGLGLLFLCASAAAPQKAAIRLVLSALLILVGSGGAAWSGMVWRRLNETEPRRLADRIVEMVRQEGKFETTNAEAIAGLSAPADAVQTALDLLRERGEAIPESRDERMVYVFPNLKQSMVVRRCPYCGAEFPVKQAISTCPNCGGKIELERT